ncbi:MAG: ATP-grasp domain-containing protein [archaeon]|nr:ATP-grasp domain-containing protein [archaeon]
MYDLSNVNKESILIFEYFTASGENDPSIISEAKEIIRSLVLDLKELDIYVLISDKFENIFDDIVGDSKINLIKIESKSENSLENWLENNVNIFSRAMFIAAENNGNLYNITKILESNDVEIYGSDSYAVKLASDKFETFDYFYGKLKQPETFNILFNAKTYWKRAIQIFFDKINGDYGNNSDNDVPILQKPKDIPVLDNSDKDVIKDNKLILKPRFGVDCENIKLIKSKLDIDDLESIESGSRFVVQEFIGGIVASVSLISDGKTAIPISLNKQIVEINENGGKYIGGELPFEHPLKEDAFKLAKLACEYVPGIKGFVGVDIIINEDENEVYLIEINSRFTTSYVGLQRVANFNIAKSSIDLLDGKINSDDVQNLISYSNKVSFLKDENGILSINVED